MKIPREIIESINKEELIKLVKFYGTDFYTAYLNQLKKKYIKLHNFLEDEFPDDPKDSA